LIALLVGPVAGEGPLRDGVTALLFYVAIYGAMNLGAFALLTAFESRGRSLETLDDLAGMATRAPAATFALAICLFSLMGLPPTAGFLGKLYIFGSAFSVPASHAFHGPIIALAIIGIINSVIAAAYYLRMVSAAYMGEAPEAQVPVGGIPVRVGLALCSLPMLFVFAWPGSLVQEAQRATNMVHQSLRQTTAHLTRASDPTAPDDRATLITDRPAIVSRD
jgi:NADH-quinone oxidoreductase subunit N